MRHTRLVPALAAVVTLAAATPPAFASDNVSSAAGAGAAAVAAPVVHHHTSGSTDWALIGFGAAGALGLLGAGVAASVRTRRPSPVGAGIS